MNAIGASILAAVALVLLFGSRRWALLAMMVGVVYVPQSQQVDVLGINMFSVRFLEIAGFIRVMSRGEFSFSHLNRIDRALLLLYGFTIVVFSLRSSVGRVFVIGTAVDAWLCYFTFRGLIVDMGDFRWLLRAFVFLLAPYAVLLVIETLTKYNVFSLLGGGIYEWERQGRYRCMGSFRHPDLLGTLGASFLPLYIGLACGKTGKIRAVIAAGLCLVIVWASNSGGPACAAAVGLAGWMCWMIRSNMRLLRWGIAGTVLLAAILMKAPVWYLLARISDITGGDGYHRAYLMDISFRHLGRWWLDGIPISDTMDWFPYSLISGADITNQFISFGLNAGIGAVALLILLLVAGFSALGRALDNIRAHFHEPTDDEYLIWGLGVMLAVHIINWFGITYFDQFYVIWFMQLAIISGVTEKAQEIVPTFELDESGAWPQEEEEAVRT